MVTPCQLSLSTTANLNICHRTHMKIFNGNCITNNNNNDQMKTKNILRSLCMCVPVCERVPCAVCGVWCAVRFVFDVFDVCVCMCRCVRVYGTRLMMVRWINWKSVSLLRQLNHTRHMIYIWYTFATHRVLCKYCVYNTWQNKKCTCHYWWRWWSASSTIITAIATGILDYCWCRERSSCSSNLLSLHLLCYWCRCGHRYWLFSLLSFFPFLLRRLSCLSEYHRITGAYNYCLLSLLNFSWHSLSPDWITLCDWINWMDAWCNCTWHHTSSITVHLWCLFSSLASSLLSLAHCRSSSSSGFCVCVCVCRMTRNDASLFISITNWLLNNGHIALWINLKWWRCTPPSPSLHYDEWTVILLSRVTS